MEKSKILVIGCGGCGGRQLDVLLDYDIRYTGIFMNTNIVEMENLHNFDAERRCFSIPNACGTGKNRDVAEKYIKQEAPKFAEMIKKFVNQNTVIFLTSTNGGTGSKAVTMLSKVVKKMCPDKSLNIVATFPRGTESDIDYENTIDFWNEVMELKERFIIDTVQFIDNNKSFSEEEINVRAMKELHDSFDIINGKIDNSDSQRVHTSNGYKVILKLDKDIADINQAIEQARNSSVFFFPETLACDMAIGNINVDVVPVATLHESIEILDFNKFNEVSNADSYILLGGCEMPKQAIQSVKRSLNDIKERKKLRVMGKNYLVEKDSPTTTNTNNPVGISKSKLSSEDLTNLFADDEFWK